MIAYIAYLSGYTVYSQMGGGGGGGGGGTHPGQGGDTGFKYCQQGGTHMGILHVQFGGGVSIISIYYVSFQKSREGKLSLGIGNAWAPLPLNKM